MTIAQRLVRAGLAFIVFGTVASLVPTNGTAMANVAYTPGKAYTFGQFPNDTSNIANLTAANPIINLIAYQGTTANNETPTDVTFTYTITGSLTVRPSSNASKIAVSINRDTKSGDSVIIKATFGDGTFLTYTVTAK